ncbi:MAG: hypothetical protein VW806_06515 [Halieaceae bacterium]
MSYTGGWTIIEESDRQSSSALVHYTPAPSWSIGLRTEVNRDNDYAIYSVHPTFLAKRWFGKDYQGNLYFHGGIGVASGVYGNPLRDETAVYGGIMADWETRSLFAGYRSRYLDAGHFGDQFMHAARVGYAPYEGDSGDLHTWLMLEIDHRPEEEVPITATPLVRLFKGPLLLEVGYNLTVNQPLLNFTYRF